MGEAAMALGVWIAAPAAVAAVGAALAWKWAGEQRAGGAAGFAADAGPPSSEVHYSRTSERAQMPTMQRTETPERSAPEAARGGPPPAMPRAGFSAPDIGAMNRTGGAAADTRQRGAGMAAGGRRPAEPARTVPTVGRA